MFFLHIKTWNRKRHQELFFLEFPWFYNRILNLYISLEVMNLQSTIKMLYTFHYRLYNFLHLSDKSHIIRSTSHNFSSWRDYILVTKVSSSIALILTSCLFKFKIWKIDKKDYVDKDSSKSHCWAQKTNVSDTLLISTLFISLSNFHFWTSVAALLFFFPFPFFSQ